LSPRSFEGRDVKLDTLILADAVTIADGKCFVHGGGFTRYDIANLPAPIPIGIFARLLIEDGDYEAPHHIVFSLFGPTGDLNVPAVGVQAIPPADLPPLAEGEEPAVQISAEIPAVAVRVGVYRFEMTVDGTLVRTLEFPVLLDESGLSN
ncbi:MAG TPA: hypothetical protein VFO36_04740, partial [Nitrospiraceae bacterium]|nr:hypothetical protein [Nitrospiraceae bacterium]